MAKKQKQRSPIAPPSKVLADKRTKRKKTRERLKEEWQDDSKDSAETKKSNSEERCSE